jgi:hypothetical protein
MAAPTKFALKGAGRAVLRILFPFLAIGRTLALSRDAVLGHKERLGHIGRLAARAGRRQPLSEQAIKGEQSFEEAIRDRSPGAASVPELYRYFLLQKRIILATGAVFCAVGLHAVAQGAWLGIATVISGAPLSFVLALNAQLRLWQLRTRRLSKAERGGLLDFIRETDRWAANVLDPEIRPFRKDPL